MKRYPTLLASVALLLVAMLILAGSANADRVTPIDTVTSHVKVRRFATINSNVVGQLAPGESARFVDAAPYWYEVVLDDGTPGFVSKRWTSQIADAHTDNGPSPNFDFWITKDFLFDMKRQGIMYELPSVKLTAAGPLHSLGKDCEMHITGFTTDGDRGAPHAFVIEPPNLCKNKPPTDGNWKNFVKNRLLGKTCKIIGFPRIFDEHLTGEETPTNPHHMLEIHPALKIDCGGSNVLDATTYLKYYEGMSEIKPESAAKCFNTEVWVRESGNRYEFRVKRPRHCGNFASFEMAVFTEWIKALSQGGHSALARVKPAGSENFTTLKIYTMPGTAEDTELESWRHGSDPHHGVYFHGMTTLDYFSIVKVVTKRDGTPKDVPEWTNVPYPLALVVFGTVPDPDPEEDPGEDFH